MLADFIEMIVQAIEYLVTAFGAVGIVIIAFLENVFPPTPSEFLYPLAGKMAYDGFITPVEVMIAGVIGSLAGALLYYTLGYHLGEQRIRNFILRYGTIHVLGLHIHLFSVGDYDRGLRLFSRHGGAIVFVARLMPVVHGVISIPAGVIRMNLGSFLVYTALGAAAWIAPLTLFGYWLGSSWQQILYWLDIYENIWYILMIAVVVFFVVRRIGTRRARTNAMVNDT